jgi:hypothetical protein
VGLPPPKNYEQALAEEQALMRAEEQIHKQAAEKQTRLKRQRQGSVISIFLSIASVVLSAIAMIGVTSATHLSLMFILLATIIGIGIGIEVTVQSLRKLNTRDIVATTTAAAVVVKVPTVLAITAATATILAIIAAAILAVILAEALVTSGAIAIVIAGLGLLAAAIILVGTAAVVIIKSHK